MPPMAEKKKGNTPTGVNPIKVKEIVWRGTKKTEKRKS